jgi:hypothetical protein
VTPGTPDVFFNPERVTVAVCQPGARPDMQAPGEPVTPGTPDVFFNPERVAIAEELPTPAGVGGFVPLAPAPQSTLLSMTGTYSLVPLVPGVRGPDFVFGEARVTAGVLSTPRPVNAATPAVPLVATPQPLNAQPPVPVVSTPQPLNAQPPVPLVSTPVPLNAQPLSATPPGAAPGAGTAPAP